MAIETLLPVWGSGISCPSAIGDLYRLPPALRHVEEAPQSTAGSSGTPRELDSLQRLQAQAAASSTVERSREASIHLGGAEVKGLEVAARREGSGGRGVVGSGSGGREA